MWVLLFVKNAVVHERYHMNSAEDSVSVSTYGSFLECGNVSEIYIRKTTRDWRDQIKRIFSI